MVIFRADVLGIQGGPCNGFIEFRQSVGIHFLTQELLRYLG